MIAVTAAVIHYSSRLQPNDEVLFARLLAYLVEAVVTVIFGCYDSELGQRHRMHSASFSVWDEPVE